MWYVNQNEENVLLLNVNLINIEVEENINYKKKKKSVFSSGELFH